MNRALNGILIACLIAIFSTTISSQVGINTSDPKGALDVVTNNNTGLVLPRVSSVEDVTDGNGNAPLEGTTVFDVSRNSTCFYQNGDWVCIIYDGSGNPILSKITDPTSGYTYVKASNTDIDDEFGSTLVISEDGNTLVVGSFNEKSNAVGINGNQFDNSLNNAGVVYVFSKSGSTWMQQAYIKASNTGENDFFARSIALSSDGNTLAVGAPAESSNATGINGNQSDNSEFFSGAVYVFTRTGSTWSQQAYIKASNTDGGDSFGVVALSSDGNTLAVGSPSESSNATGIGGNQADNTASGAGAVYIFTRSGTVWSQQEYIKGSNTESGDSFGRSVALSSDGNTLAVGAPSESSNATGINGNQSDNTESFSGAVYIFTRTGSTWSQQAYIKASNTESFDFYGTSIALSADGNTLAASAYLEASNATGINGNQSDNSSTGAGAVYIYTRSGAVWSQEAYIKASNTGSEDNFGEVLDLSSDGNILVVSGRYEDGSDIGLDGDESSNTAIDAGAAYIFERAVSWSQIHYVKASNTDPGDEFGSAVSLSGDGTILVVGAGVEHGASTGIDGDQTSNIGSDSGAAYIIILD